MTGSPLSEVEFLAFVRRRLPVDRADLSASTTLASLPHDKVSRAAMRGILIELLPSAPEDLLGSIETLGDLLEWHHTHAGGGIANEANPTRVRLRPLADRDLGALYEASTAPDRGFRWRYRGATPSMGEFHSQLFEGVLCQFIVAVWREDWDALNQR